MPAISDRDGRLGELPVFWREAQCAPGVAAPVVYLHGVPSNSDEWRPFLELTGGLAPDLPGFGRSGKPGHFPYTIEGYGDFIESFLELAGADWPGGLGRVSLVMHDWGSVGLAFAQRHPERVERLVLMNAVPLLAGYRWHRTARIWRTPLLGELAMGITTRRTLRVSTRESNVTPGPLPREWMDSVLAHFDQGTQRAILRLYRSSPPETLAAAGARLGELRAPALVVWGAADPYIPVRFAGAYARALPEGELLELSDAGHWPWLDRPDVIERVAAFLGAGDARGG
ncbi:MAG TPA: alpha/beta hydrolase [Solirubrobacteraceae bacterium]|nr:alpha/beta hydrolase [Solirubrobacteraceae bacterium]